MTNAATELTFDLEAHEFVELHNLLKITGLCHSGAMAKHVIADGLVMVDHRIELRKRCKIRNGQLVQFNDHNIKVVATPG